MMKIKSKINKKIIFLFILEFFISIKYGLLHPIM